MSTPEMNRLAEAVDGLLLPSESDEPIGVVHWDGGAEGPADGDVLRLAGQPPGTKVEQTDIQDIFRDGLAGAEAPRFHAVCSALDAALGGVRVYRVGDVEKDVLILGKVKGGGGWAGLRSKVVET